MSEQSAKPYLVRAICEWCADNGLTPYLAVKVNAQTRVPTSFVKNGEIVLNISTTATRKLTIENEWIQFAARFNGVGWGEVQDAGADKNFRILRWDEEQGPLAKTDEGLSLPLPQVTFQRRQVMVGQKSVLAAFEDGTPFLTRQTLARGEIYFCASLPEKDWSSLGEGTVLVPMLQRLLQAGSRRLQQTSSIACGELSASDRGRNWESVDSIKPKDIRFQAGVYRAGERLVAVNRPAAEDEPEILEADETHRLFGDLPFQMLLERRTQMERLQGEIWRLFLFAMLLFLIAEGILILPAPSTKSLPQVSQPVEASARAGVRESTA